MRNKTKTNLLPMTTAAVMQSNQQLKELIRSDSKEFQWDLIRTTLYMILEIFESIQTVIFCITLASVESLLYRANERIGSAQTRFP